MNSAYTNSPCDVKPFAAERKSCEAVYVHGLLLRGQESFRLALRLRRRGIRIRRFHYLSRKEAPEAVAARLAMRLRASPDLHIVAHSLGGVIALLALEQAPAWRGRAVLLGAPVRGSGLARRMLQLRGGRFVLGVAAERLCAGLDAPAPPPGRIAVVAGTRNVGISRLLAACPPPGDGVVCLQETLLPGAAERVQFDTLHIGLVYSPAVIDWVGRFIRAEA